MPAPNDVVGGEGVRGEGRPLDRAVIINAAQKCVDAEGLPALTMRHLGACLGVEGMAIYRHFSGRSDLLDQMRARLLSQARREIDWRGETWQDVAESVAAQLRRLWHRHPAMIPVLTAYDAGQPWLRPPLALLGLVDDLLAALNWHGLSDRQSVAVYRGLSAHLLGATFAAQSRIEFEADLRAVLAGLQVPLADRSGAR
ncbi:MAG: TetR family transcriptional regulator [Ornithinimicrobium sp.]